MVNNFFKYLKDKQPNVDGKAEIRVLSDFANFQHTSEDAKHCIKGWELLPQGERVIEESEEEEEKLPEVVENETTPLLEQEEVKKDEPVTDSHHPLLQMIVDNGK